MVLLLRYSGLRMQDAACLERGRVADGRLFLQTQKTGTVVYCPLPPEVAQRHSTLSRTLTPTTSSGMGGASARQPSRAGIGCSSTCSRRATPPIVGGHPHRFRDTFAVSLLLKGVSLESVSKLLGHTSIKVTERHYAPWVKARQEQLEADVRRTWTT